MAKYIKKKDLKNAIDECTWYHIGKGGELVEGANSYEHEPLYKYSDIKKIIKGLPTRKFEDESTAEDSSEVEWVYNKRERLWYPYSNGELLFKDKPTTQTETQNSNLTFEKADEPQTENPCDGCVCDDGKHLMYCMNCKGIAWKTEPPKVEDEPQTDCYVSDLCKHYGDKQICGRCRSRSLFCEAEPQPRCPKCGKRGYIRSLESMGVKLKVFDEYKWKCTNCNKYFKEEPKDEPQTDCAWK